MVVGRNPRTADEVNGVVGELLRLFTSTRTSIIQHHDYLEGVNLAEEFSMDPDDEAALKAAINTIWSVIQPMDMTFVKRVTGLF